jgi:hypothetical protein
MPVTVTRLHINTMGTFAIFRKYTGGFTLNSRVTGGNIFLVHMSEIKWLDE